MPDQEYKEICNDCLYYGGCCGDEYLCRLNYCYSTEPDNTCRHFIIFESIIQKIEEVIIHA